MTSEIYLQFQKIFSDHKKDSFTYRVLLPTTIMNNIKLTENAKNVHVKAIGTTLMAVSYTHLEVWDVRGSAGATSSNLCLFETGTNHPWFNP